MRRLAGALAAVLALALIPSTGEAKPAAKATAARDWTHTFAATPDGGFRMGKPDAKIAIVEYGSLTCPHCRHFAETAMKPLLAKYVRTGKASYEYRSLILNDVDVAATLVARCGGPARFFPMAEALYATQPTWIGKITDEEGGKIDALPEDQKMLGVARAAGLIRIAAAHGIPAQKAETCLKNEPAVEELRKMAQAAVDEGIGGTPTFYVNGEQVPAYDWETLEPFLKQAGG